jgi:hypothetical protein
MSIQEIITIIKEEKNLYNNNFYLGDFNEYTQYGRDYIKLLSDIFPNHSNIKNTSITIINNNKKYIINYIIKLDEIYWTITMI